MAINIRWGTAFVACVALVGCAANPNDDGNSKENQVHLSNISTAAKQADGDFDKLPADMQKQALDMAHGDQAQAKSLVKMMAHPPNEGQKPPAGPPPH